VTGAPAPRAPASEAPPQVGARRDFDVFRLRLGQVVAFVAALALMFIMAGNWYSTYDGVRAREIEQRAGQGVEPWGRLDQSAVDDARDIAQKAERNAWRISSFLDALVLVSLLVAVALAIAAAALQAAGRTFDPGRSPSVFAGYAALVAFLLVAVQTVVRLGSPTSPYVFQVGLPLGAIALGAIAFGSAMAVRDATSEGERAGGEPRPGRTDRARAAGAEAAPAAGAEAPRAPGPEGSSGATYNRAS
jgi:hypothetical protein